MFRRRVRRRLDGLDRVERREARDLGLLLPLQSWARADEGRGKTGRLQRSMHLNLNADLQRLEAGSCVESQGGLWRKGQGSGQDKTTRRQDQAR